MVITDVDENTYGQLQIQMKEADDRFTAQANQVLGLMVEYFNPGQ